MSPSVMENATNIRKNWSETVDKVVRNKPVFMKRTHDNLMLSDIRLISYFLELYTFEATAYTESDKSTTLSLDVLDISVNEATFDLAINSLAHEILEYANDFYAEYEFWSKAPNRQTHIPYVFKALIAGDEDTVKEMIVCQNGQN